MVLILLLKHHPEHNVTMTSDNPWVTTALSISLQAFYIVSSSLLYFTVGQSLRFLLNQLYTAGLVFVTQQLAVSAMIAKWHYLTAVHDISHAWTGIGAAIYALWQQTKIASSIWTILGVATYLACVSILHIASTTIMQFTAFNSTSNISVQSTVTWPNSTVLANGTWVGANQMVPPSTLLGNMETVGLLNNTIYDIVDTTDPALTTAIVNATSLQANCGLLSNLTFSNSGISPMLNFSVDGLGNASFLFSSKFLDF